MIILMSLSNIGSAKHFKLVVVNNKTFAYRKQHTSKRAEVSAIYNKHRILISIQCIVLVKDARVGLKNIITEIYVTWFPK